MTHHAPDLYRLAVVLALVWGCGRENAVVRREGEPDVLAVDSTDPGMLAAIDSARSSAAQLIERVNRPPTSQSSLAVKIRVAEGTIVEHLWITEVRYDGSLLAGIVSNDPVDLVRVRPGDTLRVRPAEISDWMAIDRGRLVGGYSIRLLRARMSPADRARFDSSIAFSIEP